MKTTNVIPQAREEGLMIRELPDEVLIYDLDGHKAHCLNSTAASIWKQCDGRSTAKQIAARLANELRVSVDEDVVWVGVRRLSKANLLVKRVAPPATLANAASRRENAASRREVLKKVALVGGLSVASIFLPTVADAASHFVSCNHVTKNGVSENGKCCTGNRGICHITQNNCGTCGPQSC